MFLSYNYVPFTKSYRESHNINDDLSNAYLCFDGDFNIFNENDIELNKYKLIETEVFLLNNNLIEEDVNFIKNLISKCPLLYNSEQCKYIVYFVLTNEEKSSLSNNFSNNLCAKNYYEIINEETGKIIHKYYPEEGSLKKKFWIFSVSL